MSSDWTAGDTGRLMRLRSRQARDGEREINGEAKVSCIWEMMSRCSFLESIRGVGWLRLKTGDAHCSCGASHIWTVFSANQSTENRCHCSATSSCQNLPRRVGGIINSFSSAGPHFTGGGPPDGVPWPRMMRLVYVWGATELVYIVRRQDWITVLVARLPLFFLSVFRFCLSLFSPCVFLYIFFPSFRSLLNPLSKCFLNNYVVFPVFIVFFFFLSVSSVFP